MLFAKLKNILIILTTNLANVNSVIYNEVWNVTMRINYQINEKYIMKKNRDVLLAKSKLNQQNRNYEKKMYKQQMEELKKS